MTVRERERMVCVWMGGWVRWVCPCQCVADTGRERWVDYSINQAESTNRKRKLELRETDIETEMGG